MWIRRAARHLGVMLVTVVAGSLLGATLVRLAPGFGVDEQELDARLEEDTLQAIRQSRAAENDVVRFYARYLQGLLKGDLGTSRSLGRPVAELFADRIPVTFHSAGIGLLGGWLLGLALALPAATGRRPVFDLLSTVLSGIFLCLPSALLALLLLLLGGPGRLAIALVVFPRVFRYARNVLVQTYARPHVLMARAKGLGGFRTLLWHVVPSAGPQILALAGISAGMAFSAAVPVEVICDSPGVGQLAWLAALGRDLPLLVNIIMLTAVVTLAANSASDLVITAWAPHRQ